VGGGEKGRGSEVRCRMEGKLGKREGGGQVQRGISQAADIGPLASGHGRRHCRVTGEGGGA
jgi:hypothetical protein